MLENLPYFELLYRRYRSDPQLVSAEWRDYFGANGLNSHNGEGHFTARRREGSVTAGTAGLEEKLRELIHNHRARGHLIAQLDPLGGTRPCPPELKLDYYGFTESELDQAVNVPILPAETPLTVREIFARLRATYGHSTGVQFMHIDDPAVREWLQRRMENSQNRPPLSEDEHRRIFTQLTDAAVFDEFLRKKFPGTKTFSLEGGETLLPLLNLAIEKAGGQGVRDIVIGMAHRGRLNVLTHIAGKDPGEIFREFAGTASDQAPGHAPGHGDVKYHLGHSGDWTTASGHKIHVSLCFNPSHLEFVNPVVLGRVRARQDRLGDRDRLQGLSLLIHGDAAFAGEGVTQELLNLSRLAGYTVGGTLHVMINNQIGFTTSPDENRSTVYATDAALMLQAPIFHVNGEDLEAVAQVVRLALDFRHEFQSDVFIDLYGYRRWGHNETDEPSFTQPVLYKAIQQHKNVRESYLDRLLELKKITAETAGQIAAASHDKLEQVFTAPLPDKPAPAAELCGAWQGYTGGLEPMDEETTGVKKEELTAWLHKLAEIPDGFHLHPKLERGLTARREMGDGKHPLDWAAAEALTLATLAAGGVRIRMSGQDVARGTFSHRHAVFYDHETGQPFCPLQHLSPGQGTVEILNSPLSETGVLGFEYGYSLDCPGGMVIWEAQFGDFVNAAQVILDQFITSAEEKWQRLSGLVLLLPHGFEGMGPEHSSARIERFLALAAGDNIQVAQPTTPAQFFHLLRRQGLRRWRKPLVVFTPKSLLRHPEAVSSLEQLADGGFQRLLPDSLEPRVIKRLLLCTGKIYYELAAYREQSARPDVAIIRLEQLYPLHAELLEAALRPYADNLPVLWVQEEPANMGAWRYLHEKFGKHLFGRFPLALISRRESASPATGSAGTHKREQANLIRRAFGEPETQFQKNRPDQGKEKKTL